MKTSPKKQTKKNTDSDPARREDDDPREKKGCNICRLGRDIDEIGKRNEPPIELKKDFFGTDKTNTNQNKKNKVRDE